MKLSRLIAMSCLSLLLAGTTWAQEEKQTEKKEQKEVCPHPEWWTPTKDEMQRILADHSQWVRVAEEVLQKRGWKEGFAVYPLLYPDILEKIIGPQGRANLCNVNWAKIKIENAHLAGAKLNNAHLSDAQLDNADFRAADLNNADLSRARLNHADLSSAQLNGALLMNAELNHANLTWAELNDALLIDAQLNHAKLTEAKLNNASLSKAQLNGALLAGTQLNNASLSTAKLNNAFLLRTELNHANLFSTELKGAALIGVLLSGAKLAHADLTGAIYAPESAAPDPYVAGIKGLDTVHIAPGQETIAPGQETGLVQLRELLQKAGLRDLEREATFRIEYWRTRSANDTVAERYFRMAAFEWTTAYGLYPGRALKIILVVWILLSLVYFWPIYLAPKGSSTGAIYQVWSTDRIETSGEAVSLSNSPKVNRLKRGPLGALGYAAYFSLLSAFYIGWRELNVGSWIARIQPREYALRATGWVRAVSGVQSLLSVYLLAIWVLTYFGRPFQ
jgi:uncharacterized protein YjbI with pentapeptide repeats